MKKTISYLIIFAIIGLIVGYLFFGKIAGEYVELTTIFNSSENALESFGRSISGIKEMKQNILISGGVGAILGVVIAYVRRK